MKTIQDYLRKSLTEKDIEEIAKSILMLPSEQQKTRKLLYGALLNNADFSNLIITINKLEEVI